VANNPAADNLFEWETSCDGAASKAERSLPPGGAAAMNDIPKDLSRMERVAAATPEVAARRLRSLSDRTIAWIFIAPTLILLLAINIFPLIWAIRLSFTGYRANRPNAPLREVGIDNFHSILTDPDIWAAMQATAHFVVWTIALQTLLGFGLAWLIDRKFRGHGFWTTVILIPMMLSPAVVGNFWKFLFQPQIGLFNYAVSFVTGIPPSSFEMLGSVKLAPWAIVIVDTWMWTPYVMLICLAGLRSIPDYIYEAAEVDRASRWRQFWSITLPMALPFIMLAVLFRGIENFKMFDMVNLLTSGGPGSTTEVASITLKREAFEKWRTGFSSAFAIILFVTVFGLANIYVRALNKVKQR
jgi:multiple sugar transport system permease protein